MKILALAATNHKSSINRQLLDYALTLFQQKHQVRTLDLNDFDAPIFSPHRAKKGLPAKAQAFADHIAWADLIIISFAEYNGSYTPVFKNLLDWASTTQEKLFKHKELVLMATSPGGRGAQTVLKQATHYFPFMGGTITGSFSLPKFNQHFNHGTITESALNTQLENLILRAEATPIPIHPKTVKYLDYVSKFWVLLGYSLIAFITANAWLGAPWFPVTSSNLYWEVAMIAATFTLVIRPIYDLFPQSDILRELLKWRKGIGLISSGIVISFWLGRNVSLVNPSVFWDYFSANKWSLSMENLLERTTEITAWTLFLISNKWMVLHANRLWRRLQKLAYVYFLSAALLLTLIHEKTYGLVCLVLFFAIYQVWIYKKLLQPKYNTHSEARRSQAS